MACGILALDCDSYVALKSWTQEFWPWSWPRGSRPWPRPWPLDFGLNYNTAPSFHWLGWIGSTFLQFQLGWVSQSMGWVGLGHIKWTHGQHCDSLCDAGVEYKWVEWLIDWCLTACQHRNVYLCGFARKHCIIPTLHNLRCNAVHLPYTSYRYSITR